MTKILLVEDDKSLREIYGVRLLAEGYDIISAGDGEAALAMAIKDRPSLIVSDVMMPKISGFDMLDILRSTTETKDIKVIMMTALSSDDQRQRGVALGADRYLVKSQVGIEDVVRTVHEVLGDAPTSASSSSTPSNASPAASGPTLAVPPRPTSAPTATPSPAPAPVSAPQPSAQPFVGPSTPPAASAATAPPAPAESPSGLPQPTAPFSTPRPANLGDRVIHPLESNETPPDFAHLMNQELAAAPSASAPPPTPETPASPPAPTAPSTPSPMPSPTPPPAPSAPASPSPVQDRPSSSGLSFEETSPRTSAPSAPPTTPPTPPAAPSVPGV